MPMNIKNKRSFQLNCYGGLSFSYWGKLNVGSSECKEVAVQGKRKISVDINKPNTAT